MSDVDALKEEIKKLNARATAKKRTPLWSGLPTGDATHRGSPELRIAFNIETFGRGSVRGSGHPSTTRIREAISPRQSRH